VSDERCTVLLCYDGSPQSEHAAAISGKLFAGAHAEVLYVWEPIERIIARYSVLAPFMGEELGAADADAEAEATKVAAAGAEIASRGGLEAVARTAQLVTTVWEAVLATADEVGADVIVTGTRSLHGLREIVSNTLSHHLVQHSPRPVLAIPTAIDEE
jgi:nucleotide-binding universal stress UspA family protein